MSKFIDFLGDLKAYIPSTGDLLKTLGSQFVGAQSPTNQGAANAITEQTVINETLQSLYPKGSGDNKAFYETDGDALFYPEDLFQSGNEAYILFFMRDSVYADAKLLKRVALYMPANVNVRYGAQWNPVNMLISRDERAALKRDIGSMFDSSSISSGLDRLNEILGGSGQDALMTGITKMAGEVLLNESTIGQAASAIAGKTVNPMTSLAFRSVDLRAFNFRFELMARSKNESDSINRIINVFKYGMHPDAIKNVSIGGASDATVNKLAEKVFLNYPNTFDIFLFSPSAEYLFQIQRSVLLDMRVNYNGNNVASFFKGTGAPTNITLEVDFQETELLTKDRIVQGY